MNEFKRYFWVKNTFDRYYIANPIKVALDKLYGVLRSNFSIVLTLIFGVWSILQ